jgi:hypothetical protein
LLYSQTGNFRRLFKSAAAGAVNYHGAVSFVIAAGPSYPAAREVAERIVARIDANSAAYSEAHHAPKPDAEAIEDIISAGFWASLLREEGVSPRISMALLPPEQSERPMLFASHLPLEPHALAHIAPAVERPGIHLGVWWFDGKLEVWGATRTLPLWCFVLEVSAPGLLVVKYRRPGPAVKLANAAVLEGTDVKIIEPQGVFGAGGPPALRSLLAFYTSAGHNESDDVLVRLAISMRRHQRGGSLLVVSHLSDDWRESIVQPPSYAAATPYTEICDLLGHCVREGATPLRSEIRNAIDALAGLTAVDGATVINDRFELLAFGAKIRPRPGWDFVNQVLLTEPTSGAPRRVMSPGQLGGTRHLSAAQFAHDQHDALAMVASQDGKFSVFVWSEEHQTVHAHRLESLLL